MEMTLALGAELLLSAGIDSDDSCRAREACSRRSPPAAAAEHFDRMVRGAGRACGFPVATTQTHLAAGTHHPPGPCRRTRASCRRSARASLASPSSSWAAGGASPPTGSIIASASRSFWARVHGLDRSTPLCLVHAADEAAFAQGCGHGEKRICSGRRARRIGHRPGAHRSLSWRRNAARLSPDPRLLRHRRRARCRKLRRRGRQHARPHLRAHEAARAAHGLARAWAGGGAVDRAQSARRRNRSSGNMAWRARSRAARTRSPATGKSAACRCSFDWGYFPHTVPAFPQDLIDAHRRRAASCRACSPCAMPPAREVIEDFGEEHIRTGKPIAYTSADSVLQIAAHEEHFGLERLYEVCRVARELTYPLNIGRIIAQALHRREARGIHPHRPPQGLRGDAARAHAARGAERGRARRGLGRQDRRHLCPCRARAARSRLRAIRPSSRRRSPTWMAWATAAS